MSQTAVRDEKFLGHNKQSQSDRRDKEEGDDDLPGVDQTSIFQARKTVNSSS